MAPLPSAKEQCAEKLSPLFVQGKILEPTAAIIDGTGNFRKGHFCHFHFMYKVSHFIVIEKLIRPPKRGTILQSRPSHFLLYSTTHAAGRELSKRKPDSSLRKRLSK